MAFLIIVLLEKECFTLFTCGFITFSILYIALLWSEIVIIVRFGIKCNGELGTVKI